MRKLRNQNRDKVLRPVHPNVGLELAYRRQLHGMIDDMHASTLYWVKAAYRANTPLIAQDISLSVPSLFKALKALKAFWFAKFDQGSKKAAAHYAQAVHLRSDTAMKKILQEAGFSVKFDMTPAMRDVLAGCVQENVNLIKSIPQQYLTQVETIVMQAAQTGNDLAHISKQLQAQFGVTKRRASFIARDQSSKITANLTRARQLSLGITEAKWLHSHAGKTPRPTHVAMNGKKYDVSKGMYDPDPKVKAYINPGFLINCRCVSKAIVKGFS